MTSLSQSDFSLIIRGSGNRYSYNNIINAINDFTLRFGVWNYDFSISDAIDNYIESYV